MIQAEEMSCANPQSEREHDNLETESNLSYVY